MTFISFRAATGALVFAALSPSHSLRGQSCDLVVAALAAVKADSSNTVLVDHTVIGVPRFALHAYSGIQRGDTSLAREIEPRLRSVNQTRQPIPSCLAADRHWRTIADSALLPLFQAQNGWAAFRARFGPESQFAVVSQPLMSGDTATMIVAVASGDLSGRGVLLQFVRDANGHWIKRAEAQLWVA